MDQRFRMIAALALLALALVSLPAQAQAGRASALAGADNPFAPLNALADQGGVGGAIIDVVLNGGRVYVSQSAELNVFDVSMPGRPALLTQMSLPWTPSDLVVADGLAFAFVQNSNLVATIDLRTPGQGLVINTFAFGGPPATGVARDTRSLALHGGYLYLARSGSPLTVVDVRDPRRPNTVGVVNVPSFDHPHEIQIAGNRAYILGWNGTGEALFVFDLSLPAQPALKGTVLFEKALTDLAIAGSSVVVTDYEGVTVVDVSDPARPVKGTRLALGMLVWALTVEGQRAYILSGDAYDGLDNGLAVVDIQSPAALTLVGRISIPGQRVAVPVAGGLAYVGNNSGRPVGLRVLDVRDPARPATRSVTPLIGQFRELRAVGQRVFALQQEIEGASLWTLDASTGDRLRPQGVLELSGVPLALESNGSFAYAALGAGAEVTSTSTIQVIDLTDPLTPTARGSLELPAQVTATKLVSSTLFVVDRTALRVVDVSLPEQPVLRGSLSLSNDPVALAVRGLHAYVLGLDLSVLDISDPDHPRLLGRVAVTTSSVLALDLAVIGERVFVGSCIIIRSTYCRVSVYDVSTPSAPQYISGVPLDGISAGPLARGQQLLAGDGPSLRIIDVSEQATLQVRREAWGLQRFQALDEAGGQVYGLSQGGLRLIKALDHLLWMPHIRR
ncbi:MAG TPA: hypothetical protein VFS21_27270 [Roseiflexaceae bacterium]|nr:hypothetical protein [Roseiflexaceae bacterium]